MWEGQSKGEEEVKRQEGEKRRKREERRGKKNELVSLSLSQYVELLC